MDPHFQPVGMTGKERPAPHLIQANLVESTGRAGVKEELICYSIRATMTDDRHMVKAQKELSVHEVNGIQT